MELTEFYQYQSSTLLACKVRAVLPFTFPQEGGTASASLGMLV